jgi:tetratricopeptide (TPR) repeat protein
MALQIVALAPSAGLAANVRDEAGTPTPTASGAPSTPASPTPSNASDELPPLVRPISEQRRAAMAVEKKGFWSRANPASWFRGDETNEPPAAVPQLGDEETAPEPSRWRWANPATWFRSEGEETNAPPDAASVPPAVPPVVTDSPPVAPPVAAPPAPSAPAPKPARRYLYLKPTAPPPGDVASARPVLGQALQEHQAGRLEAAVRLYEQALRLDPACTEAYQNLAVARFQQDDLPAALAASETALALQPSAAQVRLNFALALERAGFPADAAAEVERALATQPDIAAGHLLLANLCARQLAEPERARQHYQKVLELEPNHPQGGAIRDWLAAQR